jgi:peptidyl-prolyl cis-trans isomerase B (cyclophilin B)
VSTNQQRRDAAKRKLARQQQRRVQQVAKRNRFTRIGASVIAVLVVLGFAGAALSSCSGQQKSPPPAAAPSQAAGAPAAAGPCSYPVSPDEPAAKPVSAPSDTNPPRQGTVPVTMTTNVGTLPLTLDRSEAPCTVANFLSLTKAKFFDHTPCHRLVTGESLQVLQCGDPTGTGSGGPGYTIPDEPPAHLKPGPDGSVVYPAGTLAMAKTSAPNSGGSQFFLVYADSFLPPDYTVFGTIAPAGVQVLKKIAAAGEDDSNGPGDGKPKQPVQITSVTTAG